MEVVRNTKQFIEKARKIHGGKYNYSKVEYVNSSSKVCIICPEHGEFWQTPNTHLDNHGCPKCKDKKTSERFKMSKEIFIEKARLTHGDKYDYSKVDYRGTEVKVCIICQIHGEFWQTPHLHLRGGGCKKCGIESRIKSRSLTTDDFIERAKKVHGDKYDYSKVDYKGYNKKVYIICHEKDEFGNEHGGFWQIAEDHLNGHGCRKCSNSYIDTYLFIKKASLVHKNKYDYSLSEYNSRYKKVKIICPVHGEFLQDVYHHLNGHGCPKCNQSKLEQEIIDLLESHSIKYEYNKRYKFLNNLQLDFYLPDYNIAIECQGSQHFIYSEYFGGINNFKKQVENDKIKKELCLENNIKIIYYSNLGIDYPYKVIENKEELLNEINNGS